MPWGCCQRSHRNQGLAAQRLRFVCPHPHPSIPPPLQRRGLCPQHPAWTTSPAASLHGQQRYGQQPFVGANWCRHPKPPPASPPQSAASRHQAGAIQGRWGVQSSASPGSLPAPARDGSCSTALAGSVLDATAFGGAGRTEPHTYPHPAPAEQWSRGWAKEAPRGALPSPRCSVGAGGVVEPHKC